MFMVVCRSISSCPGRVRLPPMCRRRFTGYLPAARRRGGLGDRPQTDLQHERVAECWRRRTGGVGIGRDVVGRQYKAVVDIARADHILVDLVGDEIPAGGAGHHPVSRYLYRAGGKDAFAARQISQFRLGGIIAIQHADRPAIEIGLAFGFEAVELAGGFVDPRTSGERVRPVRRIGQAADIVRHRLVEAGLQSRVGGVGDRERIQAEQLIGLPEHAR